MDLRDLDFNLFSSDKLHLNKKYLSDVQLPRIQQPILHISYTNGVPSAKHA